MSTTPQITERADQPYVAIRANVTMAQLPGFADRLGEVFGWLAEHGVPPAGPPFFRYNVIDMEGSSTWRPGFRCRPQPRVTTA